VLSQPRNKRTDREPSRWQVGPSDGKIFALPMTNVKVRLQLCRLQLSAEKRGVSARVQKDFPHRQSPLSIRLMSAATDANSSVRLRLRPSAFAFSSIRLEILSSNPWIVIDLGMVSLLEKKNIYREHWFMY
jgi:hypothetical protein